MGLETVKTRRESLWILNKQERGGGRQPSTST